MSEPFCSRGSHSGLGQRKQAGGAGTCDRSASGRKVGLLLLAVTGARSRMTPRDWGRRGCV